METETRLVVGVLGESWAKNGDDDWVGVLDLGFERFETDSGEFEYSPINAKQFYCENKTTFVTRNFKSLKEKFAPNQLVLIESEMNNNTSSEHLYVTDYLKVQKLHGNQFFEVIDVSKIPDLENFSTISAKKPSTEYVMLSFNDDNDVTQLLGPLSWKAENGEFEDIVHLHRLDLKELNLK
jgi:hypothetical protein